MIFLFFCIATKKQHLYLFRTVREDCWTLHGDGKQLKEYFKDKLDVKILNERH